MGEAKRRRDLAKAAATRRWESTRARLHRVTVDLPVPVYQQVGDAYDRCLTEHTDLDPSLAEFTASLVALGLQVWNENEERRRQAGRTVVPAATMPRGGALIGGQVVVP